jgi:GNAT superfamily N-acetyltransferase
MDSSFSAVDLKVQPATPADVPILLEMLSEMAESIGALRNFTNTPESLTEALFGASPVCEIAVARDQGVAAGFAAWLEFYRPLSGRKALWLDYIYVRPESRGRPLALAMLCHLLALAKQRDYVSIFGAVLESNPAQNIYSLLGAEEEKARFFFLYLSKVDWSLLGPDFAARMSSWPSDATSR